MTDIALPDGHRFDRTGVAEAIYAEGKSAADVARIAVELVADRRRRGQESAWPILATRVEPRAVAAIRRAARVATAWDADARVLEFARPKKRDPLGKAAVVAAGTTDRPVAAEAAAVLSAYGADVARLDDVGVAGLHRLLHPSRLGVLAECAVVVVVAGMEGALPTVVAGLVRAPVVAVPSPVGYGVAAGGIAALHTMLSSCAPGVVVVNVGNGFGAATAAVKVLRAAREMGSR